MNYKKYQVCFKQFSLEKDTCTNISNMAAGMSVRIPKEQEATLSSRTQGEQKEANPQYMGFAY